MTNGNEDQIRLIAESMAEAMAVKFSSKGKKHALDLTPMEKTIVGIVTALVIGLLAWTVKTTNETAIQVAVLQEKVGTLQTNLNSAGNAQYTQAQHEAYAREMDRRVSALERYHTGGGK